MCALTLAATDNPNWTGNLRVAGATVNLKGSTALAGWVTLSSGALNLKGDTATLGSITALSLNGGVLTIDGSGTANPNRIPDTGCPVAFNGGSLTLLAPAFGSTNRAETLGVTTFGSLSSTIVLNGPATARAQLTLTTPTRGAGEQLLFTRLGAANLWFSDGSPSTP